MYSDNLYKVRRKEDCMFRKKELTKTFVQ